VNIRDLCYFHFGWLGRGLSSIFPSFERDLDSAYMKIHPEVYLSILGLVSFVSLIVSILVGILMFVGIIPTLPFLPSGGLLFSPIILIIPLLVIIMGILYPKTAASNRVAGLKIEIPYASMYISTMTSGGLSPYESILRLRKMDLLPNMSEEVGRIDIIVKSQGVDPVKGMEQAAKVIDMKDYKELLLGYASTVRTGGDTLHYLFNQTDSMFKTMSTRIKSLGENMGMLMEAYTIIGILGVLGIFLIFVVGMSLPSVGMSLSPAQFFLFSFIVLPMLSVIFIYAADAAQISYPISNWKTYSIFALGIPVSLLIGSQLTLPAFNPNLSVSPPLYTVLLWLRDLINLAEGTEAALGLAITLILVALPGAIADMYYIGREGKILDGINNFLRDLVETRKSGLAPERCIQALAGRDYGAFSKHLESISMKIHWGYPLRKIYVEFKDKIRNWLALVNIYLLLDTIEVGGGTEQSLETLANFAESTKHLEDDKKSVLMPLTIVPYIGAALFTGTTILFLQFFTNMDTLGVSVSTVVLYRVLLTPLGLHTWILGLVTGKIVSGRVSAGFKHCILLTIVSILALWAVSNLSLGGGI
jgi:flagellar protein FlaJ